MKKPHTGALSFGGISRARTYDLHDVNNGMTINFGFGMALMELRVYKNGDA